MKTEQATENQIKVSKINHFNHEIPLPTESKVDQYTPKFSSDKKPKSKKKFEVFRYYKNPETKVIYKILFLNDDDYVDQGQSPFTDPVGDIKKFKELSDAHVERIRTVEAAYIGHLEGNLILKKMDGVKLGQLGSDFQTIDDNFEYLKIGNEPRFIQFMKLMALNKKSMFMSIRIIIDQTDPKNPEVIDYEFFLREKEIIQKHQKTKA